MALIWANGFEGVGVEDLDKHFESVYSSGSVMAIGSGRNNGNALTFSSSGANAPYISKVINDSVSGKEWFFGFAFYSGNFSGSESIIISLNQDSSNVPVWISYDPNSKIMLFRRKSFITTFTDHSEALIPNSWYFIELNFKFSNTQTGKFIGRINGVQKFSQTNVDAYANAATNMSLYAFVLGFFAYQGGGGSYIKFDDAYLIDTAGSYNNTWLGDIRIDMVNPNGAGNYAQLSPSAGSNYQCVDEENFDSADFVTGTNLNDKDSYTYEDVPTALDDSNIKAVIINSQVKRTQGVDNVKIKNLTRIGSSDYKDATARSLPDSEFSMKTILERDPSDNAAWTKAKINACEFGVEVN